MIISLFGSARGGVILNQKGSAMRSTLGGVVAVLALTACHGISYPQSPTAPTAPAATTTVINLVPSPSQLPIGGGTSFIRIETAAGIAVAPRAVVVLEAESGEVTPREIVTDETGHAQARWQGEASTTITARVGDVRGSALITVAVPIPPYVPPPPEHPPAPPKPQPLPPLPPTPTLTLTASVPTVLIGQPVTLTATITNLHASDRVRAYQWNFDAASHTTADGITTSPTTTATWSTFGIKRVTCTALTAQQNQVAGETRVIVVNSLR